MTNTDILNLLAAEETLTWAAHAEAMSSSLESMFLGNAQGGEADLDDYEVRQMMAGGF